jgi:hypothetical protein
MPATFFIGLQQLGPWNETLPISGVTSCQTSSCAPSTSVHALMRCTQSRSMDAVLLLLLQVLTSPLKGVTSWFNILWIHITR